MRIRKKAKTNRKEKINNKTNEDIKSKIVVDYLKL